MLTLIINSKVYKLDGVLTVSPPADRSSSDKHTLVVSVQMVLQVLLFLGLGAEL